MKYIVLLFIFFLTGSVRAQRMVVENNKIYIESFGIRSDLVSPSTSVKNVQLSDGKKRTPYHQGIASPVNLLVSRKFQVAKNDCYPERNVSFYYASGLIDGKDGRPGSAMEARAADGHGCDEYSENLSSDPGGVGGDKGQWRIPTINEYMLMAAFFTDYDAGIPGIDTSKYTLPSSSWAGGLQDWNYLSSTTSEKDVNAVYYFKWYPLSFNTMIGTISKSGNNGRVRCIRDIE